MIELELQIHEYVVSPPPENPPITDFVASFPLSFGCPDDVLQCMQRDTKNGFKSRHIPQSPLIIKRRRWWPPRPRCWRWRGCCCIRRRCRCRPPPCRCRCSSCNSRPPGCCSPSCQFHYRVMYCSIELGSNKVQSIILFDRFSKTWGIPRCLHIWARQFCTKD